MLVTIHLTIPIMAVIMEIEDVVTGSGIPSFFRIVQEVEQ
jgi:hypothetical protein